MTKLTKAHHRAARKDLRKAYFAIEQRLFQVERYAAENWDGPEYEKIMALFNELDSARDRLDETIANIKTLELEIQSA